MVPSGCGQKQSASQKPQSSAGQKPKAPPEAEDMLKQITTVIGELDRKTRMKKVPSLQQAAPGGVEGGQGQGSQGNQESGGSQGGGSSSGGGSQGQGGGSSSGSDQGKEGGQKSSSGQSDGGQQKTPNQWQKELQSLKIIHSSWNKLEPKAVEAGLPPGDRENFKLALNDLTIAISNQRLEESLLAAIELYGQYAGLARIFTMPTPAEFYEVQYGVMSSMAEASRGDWATATDKITAISDPWSVLLPLIGKKDTMLAQQTDLSLKDLQDAISSEEINLVVFKGDIALNNLKMLEKKLSKPQSGSQSSS
ncbi:MAG: hypothetical protein GXY40_12770 [Syntrophomonadaceae bacterium]|nr:hypothetical protein [Syntrophomonadaceae bacterium]